MTVMEIYHYHVDHLLDRRKYGVPSLNKASEVAFEIDKATGKKPLRGRMIKEYWAKFKDSIALSYAVFQIKTSPDTSLLDDILRGRATFRKHGKLLPEWFGKASYAATHILAKCAEKDTAESTLAILPSVPPIPLAPPQFSEAQARAIASEFWKLSGSPPVESYWSSNTT